MQTLWKGKGMNDLTEQLKKGELPEGFYYFKLPNGETDTGKDFGLAILLMCEGGDKIEVLSEVPSYDEWQAKLEENTKLKELLKECKHNINIRGYTDTHGNLLLPQIEQALGEE